MAKFFLLILLAPFFLQINGQEESSEKLEEEELGIQNFETSSEETTLKKPFETKALIDPSAFYYVFNHGKDASYEYGGSTRKVQTSRPTYNAWKPSKI